ncbi:MAG: hypothetical protein ACYTGR_05530 [Planctomycetota bacterium]|jgi:hypothetical protein
MTRSVLSAAAIAAASLAAHQVLADGTETLGPPSIEVLPGTDYLMSGVGLLESVSGDIVIEVPAGATVMQVLLYWEGHDFEAADSDATMSIVFNGAGVTGDRIGGPTNIFNNAHSSTYRADVTAEAALTPGLVNVRSVSDLSFSRTNNGAGLLVVIDAPSISSLQDVRDGNDYAFDEVNNAGVLGVTVPQTFDFDPCPDDRTCHVGGFVSSVALEDPSGIPGRPSVVRFAIDGIIVEELIDVLDNNNGPEWDTLDHYITVPAGASSLTVSLHSLDLGGTGKLPASMVWNAASFSIEACAPPPPPGGGFGCTPGYWKQPHHFDSYTEPYAYDTLFADVFEDAFPGKTLAQVVAGRAGGSNMLRQLGKHTVAALLNAASPDVDYDLTVDEVISMFNMVFPGTDQAHEDLKNIFADFNELGCPLN